MQSNSYETKNDHGSSTPLFDMVESEFPDFISEINEVEAGSEETASRSNKSEDSYFDSQNGDGTIASCLKEIETKPTESKKEDRSNERGSLFMNSFLIELIQSIKDTFATIYRTTSLALEKVEDTEMKRQSDAQIKEEIRKMDSVLNSVLNFIEVNTPIAKTNTLYTIVEEILDANAKGLQEKNIKIVKRCEKDLPETCIHNEQVKFILHSILQYAIFSTPSNESIGFLMKSLDSRDTVLDTKTDSTGNKGGYVVVVIGFNGEEKRVSPPQSLPGIPEVQKEATDLILELARQILTRNHGKMIIESSGKRPKTLIILRFPVEKRNVVYYAPITL